MPHLIGIFGKFSRESDLELTLESQIFKSSTQVAETLEFGEALSAVGIYSKWPKNFSRWPEL